MAGTRAVERRQYLPNLSRVESGDEHCTLLPNTLEGAIVSEKRLAFGRKGSVHTKDATCDDIFDDDPIFEA